MNTRSLIVGQNLSRISQCFHKKPFGTKYKNITTGYGVDSTSKGKNLFLDVVLGQRRLADLSGFQFS